MEKPEEKSMIFKVLTFNQFKRQKKITQIYIILCHLTVKRIKIEIYNFLLFLEINYFN